MFERATRLKLRFDTHVGQLSVEDLWDLPLTSTNNRANLDEIAVNLHKQLESSSVASFVVAKSMANDKLQLGFDIVKHVIDMKIAERDAAEARKQNAERKQKLLSLAAQKRDGQLLDLEPEALEEMAAAL